MWLAVLFDQFAADPLNLSGAGTNSGCISTVVGIENRSFDSRVAQQKGKDVMFIQ